MTTICDLPLEITEKIKDMVAELHLQDHKKKFEYALEAIPDVANVLWTSSTGCPALAPIKIKCLWSAYYYDDYDNHEFTETQTFLSEVHTDLTYLNIHGMLTESSHYHDTLIDLQ